MPLKYAVELFILAAIWGASFIFMRTATPEFGPIPLMTVRTSIAAIVLFPLLLHARLLKELIIHWRVLLIIGLLNTAIPFCLFNFATLHLQAGFASVLNATAPMFGAVVGFYWLKDRLSHIAVFGLILGFVGVGVLSVARTVNVEDEASVLPILAALLATFLYGVAACYAKRYLQGLSSILVATGSQLYAALCLLPVTLLVLPEQMPSNQAWINAIVLGVLCTAIAYILYFRLISNVGSARAITVAYLVPVFGVMWGMLFLDESMSLLMGIGAALVILGVAMTTGFFKRKSAPLVN